MRQATMLMAGAVSLGLCLWAVSAPTSRPSQRRDAFDGKWKVTLVAESGDQKAPEDVLVFYRGKFKSEAFEKRGFAEVEYQTDIRRYGPQKFTATATSGQEGTCKWSGVSTGQEIRGDMVWTKKDGSVVNYTFNGEKV